MLRIILILISIFTASHASAEMLDKKVEIDSDELKYYTEQSKAVFKGHVVAVHGDITLHANECVVLFEKRDDESKDNSVKSIELIDNVKIITPKEEIESRVGLYDTKKGTITLTGDVKLRQDKNTLYGDKLVHNVKTGESVLTSTSKKRVKAVIIPEDKNSGN